MGKLIDLTGQKFGRLTVIERDTSRTGRAYWICQCDCGTVKSIMAKLLCNGHTQSCGCYRKENMSSHRLSRTKIYRTWGDMCSRCHNPNDTGYKHYGGRGIAVCDEWRNDFQPFYDYVSKLEHFGEEGYTLDRINNNGNYEPGNVRWATAKEQSRNKTNNRLVGSHGQDIVLADLAEMTGLTSQLLRDRLERGEQGEYLLRPPAPTKHLVEINNEQMSITEIAKEAKVSRSTIHRRIEAGESGEQLLRPAAQQNHYIEINGEQMILSDVAKLAGVTKKTIYDRLARGETGGSLLRPARAK